MRWRVVGAVGAASVLAASCTVHDVALWHHARAEAATAAGPAAPTTAPAGRNASTAPAPVAPAPSASASGTATAVPASPAAPPATSPSPASPSPAPPSLDALVAGMPDGSASVAGIDTVTGKRVQADAGTEVTTGSLIKLLFLEATMLRDQDNGDDPGSGLQSELEAMVENSDNVAADQVFVSLGGNSGVEDAMDRLGLHATELDPNGVWGLSTTTATDQLTLLQALVDPNGPLTQDSQDYALGLMRNVEADQRWGVSAVADQGSAVALKNGWLNVDSDGGRWLADSAGVVTVGGHQVLLVVLTQHSDDFTDGVATAESLARAAVVGLGTPAQ